jgi:CRISPR-associated protein Csy3
VYLHLKKIVPSDGYFYGTTWDNRNEQTALKLIEKSVRGTISNRLKVQLQRSIKLNMEVEKANLQTVDACALGEHQDTLKVGFTLKVFGGIENPSACNNENFLNLIKLLLKTIFDNMALLSLQNAMHSI